MNIQGTIFFDNTKSVHDFANSPEGQKILNNMLIGNETQIHQVGDIVNGNGYSNATITEVYKQNGFYYYVCEWKIKKQIYHDTLRNKDIIEYN